MKAGCVHYQDNSLLLDLQLWVYTLSSHILLALFLILYMNPLLQCIVSTYITSFDYLPLVSHHNFNLFSVAPCLSVCDLIYSYCFSFLLLISFLTLASHTLFIIYFSIHLCPLISFFLLPLKFSHKFQVLRTQNLPSIFNQRYTWWTSLLNYLVETFF